MIIRDTQITPREAAQRFAETFQDEPRKVGTIIAAPDAAMKFQLVNGTRWYAVRLLPDYSGFDVSPE